MESNVKKTYQPKPAKVEKLKTYMEAIKGNTSIKCELFAKTIKIIVLMVLFQSCGAEYHLKQACKKKPSLCEQKVKIDTFIVHDSIYFYDTFTTKEIDTITIDTGSIRVKVVRHYNKIKVLIKQKPDTIRVTKTITLPPKYVEKEKEAWGTAHWVFFWVGLILVLIGTYKLLN